MIASSNLTGFQGTQLSNDSSISDESIRKRKTFRINQYYGNYEAIIEESDASWNER